MLSISIQIAITIIKFSLMIVNANQAPRPHLPKEKKKVQRIELHCLLSKMNTIAIFKPETVYQQKSRKINQSTPSKQRVSWSKTNKCTSF